MNLSSCIKHYVIPALVAFAIGLALPATADADPEADKAIEVWLNAVKSGDQATIAAVLAPEFQIMRSNGTGYDKGAYAAGGAAKITAILEVSDAVVTRNGDLMVVRYLLSVSETIDGKNVERKAPRLTVFRRDGNKWLVVAHANFAQIH